MRILIAGYYGFGNLGDELILESLIPQILVFRPQAAITVLSANSLETETRHGVKSVNRWNPLAIFLTLVRQDVLVLGGGGLFQDKTSFLSLFYYVGLAVAGAIAGCQVFTYAVGIEELRRPFSRWIVKFLFQEMVTKATLRDDESVDILKGLGVNRSEIFLTVDPVFGHPGAHGWRKPQETLSGCLMIPRYPGPSKQINFFAQVKTALQENNTPTQMGLFYPSKEMELFKNEGAVPLLSFGDIGNRTLKPTFIVSARYHGLVLSLIMGIPFIGVGEKEKTGRLCDIAGMPFLPWDCSDLDIRNALKKIQRMNANPMDMTLYARRALEAASFLFAPTTVTC